MDVRDERHYAWRMLRAARRAQASVGPEAERMAASVREEIHTLLAEALEAGLDRAALVMELADLGGRLLTLCEPTGDPGSGDDAGSLPGLAGRIVGLIGERPAQ